MAQFTRIQVAQAMADTGLVPLFYDADPSVTTGVLRACHEGGARLFEFTNRGDFAHEVFAEVIKAARDLPGMIVGAGSIIDAGTASLYLQLGANFIVSPCLKEDVALVCNRRKILWSAGCGTLTEISRAEELGAEVVKLFPGGTLGPDFVRAIKGPCPWTSLMPTGGVSPDEASLRSWFDAGVLCVGMGSNLIRPDLVEAGDLPGIAEAVRRTLALIPKR